MKTYFEEKTKNAMSQTQNPMNFPLQLVHCFFIAFSLLFQRQCGASPANFSF